MRINVIRGGEVEREEKKRKSRSHTQSPSSFYSSYYLSSYQAMALQQLSMSISTIHSSALSNTSARSSRLLVRPSLVARSVLPTQRLNTLYPARATFTTSSRALATPPPTGPLTPPPAPPNAVKVKVSQIPLSADRALIDPVALPSEVEEASPGLWTIHSVCYPSRYRCLHLR